MYDKKYAEAWISDHESGKDLHRSNFIIPYLKETISQAPSYAKILDVGCGWGIAIPYLRDSDEYTGIDITTEFFDYIKSRYPSSKFKLQYGGLPDKIPFNNDAFDLIICSMSLHTVENISLSIKILFSKLKPSGKLIIIDFNNIAETPLSERFRGIIKNGYCKGLYTLDCGVEVESEVFFHREGDYERELNKHGSFVKIPLGPVFVGYELTK